MLFAPASDAELYDAEEVGDTLVAHHCQNIEPHLNMCHQLREHDSRNGISKEGHFQHVASLPEIVEMILLKEKPGVLKDGKELQKWLHSDEGKPFRTCKDARPVKGDGLQVIIR